MSIRNNDINIVTSNEQVKIKETDKPNQYLVAVDSTKASFVELEMWFEMEKHVILLYQKSKWVNITDVYPVKDNRILIDKVKLKIIN